MRKFLLDKIKKIKVIVTDVDGVLTDGFIFVDHNGSEPYGRFNIYDGFGIVMARSCGIKIIVISGRKSQCTETRYKLLGVDEVYTGVENKSSKLKEIINRLQLDFTQVAYMGDDLIDLGAMSLVGLKVAPNNAVATIINYVDYVTKCNGGQGALRELVDTILQIQGKYDGYVEQFFDR